jgi:cell surface protein SprA
MTVRTGTLHLQPEQRHVCCPAGTAASNVLGMDARLSARRASASSWVSRTPGPERGHYVRDFATEAAQKGWLVQTPSIFNPYTNTRSETINGRLSLEPFKSMRIELLATRTSSNNRSSFFRWDATENRYVNDSPREFGSFSVSTINWATTFANDDKDSQVNSNFLDLLAGRAVISERLGQGDPDRSQPTDSVYWSGYGSASQDVIIPAFLAAYTGATPIR